MITLPFLKLSSLTVFLTSFLPVFFLPLAPPLLWPLFPRPQHSDLVLGDTTETKAFISSWHIQMPFNSPSPHPSLYCSPSTLGCLLHCIMEDVSQSHISGRECLRFYFALKTKKGFKADYTLQKFLTTCLETDPSVGSIITHSLGVAN